MQCGMFGKLPGKRDFVSYNMTRPFLDQWETWLQSGVAASKMALGDQWQDLFLGAPIWRYWLGIDVFGQNATGAVMPSVDGVGRYFPLTICACPPVGMRLPAPPSPDADQWLDAAERLLLQMLDDDGQGNPAEMLAQLPFPPVTSDSPLQPVQRNPMMWTGNAQTLANAFATLQAMADHAAHGKRSYWWTLGGRTHAATLVALDGAPSPEFMTQMITGALQ